MLTKKSHHAWEPADSNYSPPLYCRVEAMRGENVEHFEFDTWLGAPPLITAQSYLRVALADGPAMMVLLVWRSMQQGELIG